MKYLLSISIILLLSASGAQAQFYREKKPVTMDLNYNFSMPLGDFKNNYINRNSAAGFTADIMYWLKPGWALGGSFGFQDYYEKKPRALYKLSDGSDISAVVSNSLQTIPIMLKTSYLPMAEKGSLLQPFLSAAAGVNLVSYSQYLGEFGGSNNKASFTAQAGAGIKIPFRKNSVSGFLLGANYQFTPYNSNGIDKLNAVNLHAGVRFALK